MKEIFSEDVTFVLWFSLKGKSMLYEIFRVNNDKSHWPDSVLLSFIILTDTNNKYLFSFCLIKKYFFYVSISFFHYDWLPSMRNMRGKKKKKLGSVEKIFWQDVYIGEYKLSAISCIDILFDFILLQYIIFDFVLKIVIDNENDTFSCTVDHW